MSDDEFTSMKRQGSAEEGKVRLDTVEQGITRQGRGWEGMAG
jgi:hypothetical protein